MYYEGRKIMDDEKIRFKLSYTQIISLGFLLVILTGTLLLCLPVSARHHIATPFFDALFTATSATCVTGLVVLDTYTHWSLFGQIVIIVLIQIGGIGFMTMITMFSIFLKRRISIHERRLLMQSAGTMRISGMVRLIKRIIVCTFVMETLGAVLLFTRFITKMPLGEAIFNSIFHSISAFCNAGFDIMGKYGKYSSFTTFRDDVLVNVTLMMLIVIGGLGFIVWDDIIRHKFNFKKYELHSKIVLTTTFWLILGGSLLYYVFEKRFAFAFLSTKDKVLAAFFQSITMRTAGFNTVDLSKLSESGNILSVILMFIGGSPGSTAGGIKTTTFIVLILGVISSSRHTPNITIFKRRMDEHIVKQASAIFTIYIVAVISSLLFMTATEPFRTNDVIFEIVSAIGTVGVTRGITRALDELSKIVIMILMFGGRVGGLTLMLSLAQKRVNIPIKRPYEKILIG